MIYESGCFWRGQHQVLLEKGSVHSRKLVGVFMMGLRPKVCRTIIIFLAPSLLKSLYQLPTRNI